MLARHRQDCCAPLATSLGIAAGLTVMLISFGPGVLFLFADRWRRRQGSGRRTEQRAAAAP